MGLIKDHWISSDHRGHRERSDHKGVNAGLKPVNLGLKIGVTGRRGFDLISGLSKHLKREVNLSRERSEVQL